MQVFGRLRYERLSKQRGRKETQTELRLEQIIEFSDEWQADDTDALALRCQRAVEADPTCRRAEERRAQCKGTSDEEHLKVTLRIFEVMDAARQDPHERAPTEASSSTRGG